MDEREYPSTTREALVERSAEDIRQDIAKDKENISLTVEQIGERINEKLDWRGYVKDSPYWALGAAAGLGYLGSRLFIRRTTPVERIIGSIAEEVRGSVGGLLAGAAGSGLIKVTLMGIATKVAASWITHATSTAAADSDSGPRPQPARGPTDNQRIDT
jgi:hypothetical protein